MPSVNKENLPLLVSAKRKRGPLEIEWNSFSEAFQAQFGGEVIKENATKDRYAFRCTGILLEDFISLAEAGDLDIFVQSWGMSQVLEILQSGDCYYQAIPPISFRSLALQDISTEELRQALKQVDVLVLTATDIERQAVHSALLPWPESNKILQGSLNNRVYHLGMFGQYCVAQTSSTMGSLGRQGSTITSLKSIEEVSPKAVILIGIAFGFDRKKLRLGDVIVAESIISYELQRVGNDVAVHRGTEIQCGIVLANRFRELRSDWSTPGSDRPVHVQQGQMLSGEKLVDNKKFRDDLKSAFPLAIAGEMEGAGAYAAAGEAKLEMILVKSLCDWADGHKDDRAQPFAAFTAISLVKHVLSKRDVLNEISASSNSNRLVAIDETKPKPDDLSTFNPWKTMRQVAPELYEMGPTDKNIWQRAGGDLSRIVLSGDGRTNWDMAIRAIEKGGGGTTLQQLVLVMREDYPFHELLQQVATVLSKAQ